MALQNLRSGVANKRPIPTIMSEGQIALNTNEASPGLFFKDSNGDLVKVGPVHIGTSAPNSSPASTAATALVTGATYQILTVGTSDFTLVGASANTVGTIFTATGTTTGTGTVSGQQGVEKGEQWLDTTGGNYVLKIYDGTAWRSEAGEFVNVSGDTMTGALLLDNAASVSAPDLSFDGDANTGIYSPGADQFGVATGGTAALTIDASQQVGIGTTSPSDKLEITPGSNREGITIKHTGTTFGGISIDSNRDSASQTLGDFRFMWNGTAVAGISGSTGSDTTNKDDGDLFFNTSSSGANTERMRIDSSGRVGVGTSSPGANLEVSGSESEIRLRDSRVDDAGYWGFKSELSNGERKLFIQDDGVDRITLNASGNVGIGTTSPQNPLHIYDAVDNGVLRLESGDEYVHVEFKDSTTTSVPYIGAQGNNVRVITGGAERMRIDSSGFVGIGDTSPSSYDSGARNLVVGSSGDTGILIKAGTSSYSNLYFGDGTGTASYRGFVAYNHNGDSLRFGAAGSERMRIDSSGNVGIGTSSPRGLLHVGPDLASGATDAARINLKQNGLAATDGIYLERSGERRGYHMFIGGPNDGLTFRANNFGTFTTTMYLTRDGKVGIGTTSPGAELHVNPGSGNAGNVRIDYGTGSSADGYLNIEVNSGGLIYETVKTGGMPHIWYNTGAERMRIDTAGRLLVGTSSSPSAGAGQYAKLFSAGNTLSATGDGRIALARGNTAANLSSGNGIGELLYTDSTGGTFASIGANVDAAPGTNDYPGRLVFSTTADGASSPTERVRINQAGDVYLQFQGGSTSRVYMSGSAGAASIGTSSFLSSSTTLYIGNAAIQVSSDARLKEDIEDTKLDALNAISQVKVRDFTWNDPSDTSHNNRNARGKWTGLIAQELVDVLPFVVNAPRKEEDGSIDYDSEARWTLDQSQLCPVLIKAVQQQQDIIAGLEARLSALENA